MIQAILFDLGNVLVPVDFGRCHAALADVCPYSPQEIPRRIGATGLGDLFERGQIKPEDFVRQVSQALGMSLSYPQFWEIWSSIFLPETLLPEELLAALHRRHRLVLLSNTNAIHFALVRERYSLLGHFDGFVLSYEVGALKPAPEIYRRAVALAGCRPQECFFTDDIPAFVEAAQEQGIDAVQFQSRAQLEAELRARSIKW